MGEEEEILPRPVIWGVLIVACIIAFAILLLITTKGLSLLSFMP